MGATPLPVPLRIWSRMGRPFSIENRLRVTGRLSRALIRTGETYTGADGFRFAIDSGDAFQATMLAGLYDTLATSILQRFTPKGGTVIDAGAHLGYFTLRLARWVGPTGSVHAFEPDPRLAPRLQRHVQLNGLEWVTVNPVGLSDRAEDQPLYLPSQLGWASVIEGAWGATDPVPASMTTLDDYLIRKGLAPEQLSLIKLDVEGSELRALLGSRETLAATSAPVLVEFVPTRFKRPEDLTDLMAQLGFEPFVPTRTRRFGQEFSLIAGTRPEVGEDVLFLKRR